MLDLLHQFSGWLEAVLAGISGNFWLSILFVFLVCVGEAIFVAGVLVPSMPILLLTGGLIAQGALPFWPVFLAASAGAIAGDLISYAIGYALKDRVRTVWPFRNHLPLIAKGEQFFLDHGAKAIVIGRFITGIKAVVPGVAGMLNMPYWRFFIVNFFSSFLWAGAHIIPGMLLTDWLESMGLRLELVIIYAVIAICAALLVLHYWKRIVLLFTPIMGAFGRSLGARLTKPAPQTPAEVEFRHGPEG